MSDMLGAVLGGAGSLFGSIINAGIASSINDDQMWLAKEQMWQNERLVKEQNEYNSPANQIARYKEAGLNPNLIYGNGQSSAGNQTGLAQYHAPTLNVPQIASLGVTEAIASLVQLKQLELQNEKTMAEIDRMQIENNLTKRYINRQDAELSYYNLLHGSGKDSPAFQDYSAGIRLKNQQIDLAELEKGYKTAMTIGQKLSNQEKSFYNKKILPLMLEAKKLEIEGMSYENIIRRIDSETERLFRITNISSNPFRAAAAIAPAIFGNSGLGRFLRDRWSTLGKKVHSGTR